jgi:DnaJ like chaperone protein
MTKVEFKKVKESFFDTIFVLLGHIANCDGYVNREEIKRTQHYMDKMQLSEHCKQEAIQLFRKGSNPQFDMVGTVESFREAVSKNSKIAEVLLVYVISIASVDGSLVEKEAKLIKRVASILGYTGIVFDHLLRMISAQEKIYDSTQHTHNSKSNSHSNKSTPSSSAVLTQSAHDALGVPPDADEATVKKAYRKLVNQYHPDKIQGQGLPPEFVNAATEYFKRIHTAYEYITHQ